MAAPHAPDFQLIRGEETQMACWASFIVYEVCMYRERHDADGRNASSVNTENPRDQSHSFMAFRARRPSLLPSGRKVLSWPSNTGSRLLNTNTFPLHPLHLDLPPYASSSLPSKACLFNNLTAFPLNLSALILGPLTSFCTNRVCSNTI